MKDTAYLIWITLIMALLVGVFAIGMYEERNKDRINMENTFKNAAKRYIEVHEIKVESPVVVTYEDLKKEEYIEEVKYNDKTCKSDVIVEKMLVFFKTYKTNITCE